MTELDLLRQLSRSPKASSFCVLGHFLMLTNTAIDNREKGFTKARCADGTPIYDTSRPQLHIDDFGTVKRKSFCSSLMVFRKLLFR